MNRICNIAIACLSLAAVSCAYEGPEVFSGAALGAVDASVTLPLEGGEAAFRVYSNGSYSISAADADAGWLSFPSGAEGDGGFTVSAERNDGTPRMAVLHLSLGSNLDTVFVYQQGAVEQFFSLDDYGFTLGSAEGSFRAAISTNIPVLEISATADYDASWVSGVKIEESPEGAALSFGYEANMGASVRKGTITLSYADGWGKRSSMLCYLTQNGTGEGLKEASFAEIRALASEEGTPVADDLVIEGIVVSNTASGNMGDNEQTSTISIDYSVCKKTVYIESADASLGFMLRTVREEDNPFRQFDRVKIDLRGCTVYRSRVLEERDPVFYTIEGLTADMVVSRSEGSSAPEKKKRIGALTDGDIFTYTTLTDVELPIRKGSLTPVEEYYTNANGTSRLAKFGTLLRCIDGASMYVYTNTTCPYRRDGSRLPYGSGNLSGVVVHERFTRYSYADTPDPDTYGYIGRYQLRHTSKADFDMADSMEEHSFSALLAEWRYVTEKNLVNYPATGGSDRSAWFTHTYEYGSSSSLYGRSCVNLTSDLSYLGPVGTSKDYFFGYNGGNRNGLGVILEDGTDWMGPDYTGINSSAVSEINAGTGNGGKGIVPAKAGSAWQVWYNRSKADGEMKSWLIKFSTKGISSDVFSLQLSMVNTADGSNYGPRYWNVEYSFDNAEWMPVSSFSVPDRAATSPYTQYWMLPGFKPMDFRLPSEIGGHDTVYIRLRPSDGAIGTKLAYTATPSENSTQPWTACNYIGIRYNK